MKHYEPADDLCSVCRATLLVRVTGGNDTMCPNCEDWRQETAGVS